MAIVRDPVSFTSAQDELKHILNRIFTSEQAADAAAKNALVDAAAIVELVNAEITKQGKLYGIEVVLTNISNTSPAVKFAIDFLQSDRNCDVGIGSQDGQVALKLTRKPSDDWRDH